MRHSGWRRLRGDTERPDLLELGKELLGYLDNQRRLSGVRSQVMQRTTPDGSIVRAQWVGELPIISVLTLPERPSKKVVDLGVEGFIVRPSPLTDQYENPALNHVVVSPKWRAYFYDAAAVPADYELPYGLYGQAPPLPPMFGDGIGEYGEVDWRNADESVMVSFRGPAARYFERADSNTHHSFGATVSFKGQVLFDLAAVELALLGRTGGHVRGACLRPPSEVDALNDPVGQVLLVVACYTAPDFSTRTEYLLRFQVRPTPAAEEFARAVRARSGLPVKWQEMTALELVPDTGETLLTWNYPWTVAETNHPWYFNQSGTEARCVRRQDGGNNARHECILRLQPLERQDITHLLPTVTTTTNDSWTASPTPILQSHAGSWNGRAYVDDPVTTITHVEYGAVPARLDWHANGGTSATQDSVTARTIVRSDDAPTLWVICAVDFRDDVPVYAEARVRTLATTTTLSRDIQAVYHLQMGYAGIRLDFDGTNHSVYSESTNTYDWQASSNATVGYSYAQVTSGIRTDWLERIASNTEETTATFNSSEASIHTEVNTGWSLERLGNAVDGYYYPLTHGNNWDNTPSTHSDDATGSFTNDFAENSQWERRELMVAMLDLRAKSAVLVEYGESITITKALSKTQATNTYGAWQWRGVDPNTPAAGGEGSYLYDATNHPRPTNYPLTCRFTVDNVEVFLASHNARPFFAGVQSTPNRSLSQTGNLARDHLLRALAYDWQVLWGWAQTIWTVPAKAGQTNGVYEAPYSGSGVTQTTAPAVPRLNTTRELSTSYFLDYQRTTDHQPSPPFNQWHGTWQTYRSRFCFSAQLPHESGPVTVHGMGKNSGVVAPLTLPQVTGSAQPRFHPVSVLTRTRTPT